jgi:hypothetical protein
MTMAEAQAAIMARLTERQQELERLGDIGTARASNFVELHADVVTLATIVGQMHVDLAGYAEVLDDMRRNVTMIADMLQTAGSA